MDRHGNCFSCRPLAAATCLGEAFGEDGSLKSKTGQFSQPPLNPD